MLACAILERMASPQSLGGRTRARRLTGEERRQIARGAARARWTDPQKVIRDRPLIESFCHKYGLRRLYAFGSILTPDFTRKSDVDLLYVPKAPLDYTRYCDAVEELRTLFGRSVDFIDRKLIEDSPNEFRRRAILGTARVVYEAD
jgi:predicted nucleotidyltransferase